ncbi:MAG: hypothetical protein IIT93_02515 [Paludibacteraceae bacterium]|nr:hypothetical protein [Paludibacteraceae bacterium]
MIQLIKKDGGGRFDLPAEFEIPLELSNPYIEESGDFSLPFSLPVTSTNLSLTEYPVIRSKYSRSGIDIDCLLICGITQFDGTLGILSVTSESIEGTFISKSKDLRALLGEKTMEEVFDYGSSVSPNSIQTHRLSRPSADGYHTTFDYSP